MQSITYRSILIETN